MIMNQRVNSFGSLLFESYLHCRAGSHSKHWPRRKVASNQTRWREFGIVSLPSEGYKEMARWDISFPSGERLPEQILTVQTQTDSVAQRWTLFQFTIAQCSLLMNEPRIKSDVSRNWFIVLSLDYLPKTVHLYWGLLLID